ncbi:hypothetical protein [Rhizobium lentis]|nr:hypothetical protein [Rhizobium lentis]
MDLMSLKYVASAIAFSAAAFLAYKGKDAYGWFIFAGVVVAL